MLKKFFICLTFFLLSLLLKPIYAFEPFIPSLYNPLPFSNNFPNWNEVAQYQPSVIFENGTYKMWYASGNSSTFKIIFATSANGINWVRQILLDVYPGFDNHDPMIVKGQAGNILFFTASTNYGGGNFKIFKINLIDDTNFDPSTLKLVLQPSNSLESIAVASPFVLLENRTYYLFYLCWGNQGFRICMATSADGNQWQRCPNNPIIHEFSDGPTILKKNGKFYLFYHSSLGLRQTESDDSLSCNMVWKNFQTIPSDPLFSPSILENDNKLLLYYSKISAEGIFIGLATSQFPVQKNPVVLLPGLFGSWNKEAILHGKQVDRQSWKLTPIAKEYNGLNTTLSNLGYQENEDYYLFAYDWRKNIENIATDLNSFIQQDVLPTRPNSNISLVGHSLGGLVARIYGQKYQDNYIDKLITVGSPHQGTASVYKAVEAGEFDKSDPFLWLIQKYILFRHKNNRESYKQTISEKLPVFQDLFPTYNFLYDQNNNEINVQNMQIKNNLLPPYDQNFPALFPVLQTIVGEKGNTLSGYKVGPRSDKDILLDLYPDGRPMETKTEIGDYVITLRSAKADTDFSTLNLDHDQLVYKEEGIKSILNSLQVPYQDSQIVEGEKTNFFPSIIFLILSPAKLEVNFGGETYEEQEGIVFIENAQEGFYQLKAIGQELGFYNIIIGQIGTDEDAWSQITGEITQSPPSSQIDTYTVNYDPQNPVEFPVNQSDPTSLFDLLITQLNQIKQNLKNRNLNQALEYLQKSKQNYLEEKGSELRRNLFQVHKNLFQAISQTSDQDLISSIGQLENLYDKSLEGYLPKPSYSFLQKELERYQRFATATQQSLLSQKQRGKDVTLETNLLLLANDKLSKAESALSQYNLDLAEILLKSVKELLK